MTSQADQAALDEQRLLEEAWAAFNRAVGRTPAETPEQEAKAERVVIHNWKPEAGFVQIGDVALELEPGQSLTLWPGRTSPAPRLAESADLGVRSSLVILCEDEPLLG